MAQYGVAPFTECSASGDSRFSPRSARLRARGNRSIAYICQKVKASAAEPTGRLDGVAPTHRAVANQPPVAGLFARLYDEYVAENPDLIAVLTAASGLSNRFSIAGEPCQAAELWRIRGLHLARADTPPPPTPAYVPKRTLAIIGTAGRKEDAAKLTAASFARMVAIAGELARSAGATHLVSGGAAWADHVAVALALNGAIPPANLTLRLPAPMKASQFDAAQRDGGTANYYHRAFSKAVGRDTLAEIALVARRGATVSVNPRGFLARNVEVAHDADLTLAFTFGSGRAWAVESFPYDAKARDSNLKDGGTSHTWNLAVGEKYHVTLADADVAPAA